MKSKEKKISQFVAPDPYVELMMQDEVGGTRGIIRIVPNGIVFQATIEDLTSDTYFCPWSMIDEARKTVFANIKQ